MLPIDIHFLPEDKLIQEADFSRFKKDMEKLARNTRRRIRRFPAPVRKFLGPVREGTIVDVFQRQNDLHEAVRVLRDFANKHYPILFVWPNSNTVSSTLIVSSTLRVNESDKVEFIHSPIGKVLEGVEASRIRECRACSNIFWAGRRDQKCCCRNCRKVWHTRRWREKYLEKYKEHRIRKLEKSQEREKRSKVSSRQNR